MDFFAHGSALRRERSEQTLPEEDGRYVPHAGLTSPARELAHLVLGHPGHPLAERDLLRRRHDAPLEIVRYGTLDVAIEVIDGRLARLERAIDAHLRRDVAAEGNADLARDLHGAVVRRARQPRVQLDQIVPG